LNKNPEVLSVHLTKWPEKKELTKEQEEILKQMQLVRNLVEQGHALRKSANIKLRQALSSLTYPGEKLPEKFEEILANELNVIDIELGDKLEFDFKLTPKLEQMGLARELERKVQEMRRQNGLKVGQPSILSYNTEDEQLKSAFELFDKKRTYIIEIKQEKGGEEVEIDGKKATIKLNEI